MLERPLEAEKKYMEFKWGYDMPKCMDGQQSDQLGSIGTHIPGDESGSGLLRRVIYQAGGESTTLAVDAEDEREQW
jgi:hypothetical protein